jgi:hypothetical protein
VYGYLHVIYHPLTLLTLDNPNSRGYFRGSNKVFDINIRLLRRLRSAHQYSGLIPVS